MAPPTRGVWHWNARSRGACAPPPPLPPAHPNDAAVVSTSFGARRASPPPILCYRATAPRQRGRPLPPSLPDGAASVAVTTPAGSAHTAAACGQSARAPRDLDYFLPSHPPPATTSKDCARPPLPRAHCASRSGGQGETGSLCRSDGSLCGLKKCVSLPSHCYVPSIAPTARPGNARGTLRSPTGVEDAVWSAHGSALGLTIPSSFLFSQRGRMISHHCGEEGKRLLPVEVQMHSKALKAPSDHCSTRTSGALDCCDRWGSSVAVLLKAFPHVRVMCMSPVFWESG